MPAPDPAEPQPNHPQSRKDEFDLDDDPEAAAEAAERGDEGAAAGGKFAWSNSDREYTYDELLGEWDCCCRAAVVVCCVSGSSLHMDARPEQSAVVARPCCTATLGKATFWGCGSF